MGDADDFVHVVIEAGGLPHDSEKAASGGLHEVEGQQLGVADVAAVSEPRHYSCILELRKTVMEELAQAFPQYEGWLLALCDRVVDLLALIRSNYYHPEFHGSFSIKSVITALVPDLAYDDLEIPEGLAAAAAYARLIAGNAPQSDRAKFSEALLAYCERDTEAMVRVYEVLLAESGG